MTSEQTRQRFSEIVLPHLDAALTLARWLTGSRSDAEDVTQEACIRALAAVDAFRGGSSRAWVLVIVRHCAFTWLRKNRPREQLLTDDPERFETLGGNQIATENLPTETLDPVALHQAIANLPTPFREIIVLRDINGLSYREIGEVLKIPAGTVMSRLARARARLLVALKDLS